MEALPIGSLLIELDTVAFTLCVRDVGAAALYRSQPHARGVQQKNRLKSVIGQAPVPRPSIRNENRQNRAKINLRLHARKSAAHAEDGRSPAAIGNRPVWKPEQD